MHHVMKLKSFSHELCPSQLKATPSIIFITISAYWSSRLPTPSSIVGSVEVARVVLIKSSLIVKALTFLPETVVVEPADDVLELDGGFVDATFCAPIGVLDGVELSVFVAILFVVAADCVDPSKVEPEGRFVGLALDARTGVGYAFVFGVLGFLGLGSKGRSGRRASDSVRRGGGARGSESKEDCFDKTFHCGK